MEKFQKAYDGLKTGGTIKKKETGLLSKDKISYCQIITESVQSQQFKQHAEFPKQFSAAFEILFSLCDDANLDVRVYVDECLNTIIRNNLSEGNATRIHCELYQEIKRNGPARCLRSSLSKFADFAQQIRPNRCRTFAKNLLAPLVAVTRRPEEAVQECLGSIVDKILSVLGRFFVDDEIKILIKSILPNLQLQSAVSRRTAAIFLVELCRNSRKRYTFVSYLFKALLDMLVPVQFDQSVLQLLGCFFTLRQLFPILKLCEENDDVGQELRVTQTGTIKLRPSTSLGIDHLIQAYEATLYYLTYPHSSVVTAALETLHQLLVSGPRDLLQILLSETEGLGRSRIFVTAPNSGSLTSRSRRGSFSGIRSGMSSLGGSQTDLSTLGLGDLSIDEPNLFPGAPMCSSPLPPSIPVPTSDAVDDDDDAPITITTRPEVLCDDHRYSSIKMGELVDDDGTPSSGYLDLEQKPKALPPKLAPLNLTEGPSDIEPFLNDVSSPMSPLLLKETGFPDDIGSFADTKPPARYCGRLLCRKFLLNGVIGELVADIDVRVSQKVLALTCLEALCNLYPMFLNDVLFPYQDNNVSQRLSDVLIFANHDDPNVKGNVATMASSWLKFMTVAVGYRVEALPQETACEVVRVLRKILMDESGVAARLGVVALAKCHYQLLAFDASTCLQVLRHAVTLAKNPYWLLKAEVTELLSTIDYCAISAAEHSISLSVLAEEENFHFLAINNIINVLLADEDPRVRNSASNSLATIVRKLCLDSSPEKTAFGRRCDSLMSDFDFSWHINGFPLVHCLAKSFNMARSGARRMSDEENLSYVIDFLISSLCRATNKHHTMGCLTALQRLAESFPPSLYESGWCISADTKSAATIDFLRMLLSILRSVSFGTDVLVVHQALFQLIGSLFAGSALRHLANAKDQKKLDSRSSDHWPSLMSSQLGEFANELFNYCLRIISIYWHAVTEQQPSAPPVLTKPPLPQLPQASSLTTPVANKLKAVTGSRSETKQDKIEGNSSPAPPPALPTAKYKASDFYSSIHLMRIFEMVKGAWSNYKTSLDAEVEEKFCFLLRSCLDCMNTLLEVASIGDVEKITEEFLAYLKPLMPILPAEVVTTTIQLLKSLFGTNLPMLFQSGQPYLGTSSVNPKLGSFNNSSVFQSCVLKERARGFNHFASAATRHDLFPDLLKQHLGWFGSRGERHVMSLLKNSTSKATLTNFIRLFEPIVVQCLRLYTSCVGVELQCSVISLLSQLIQIRVNYSLLDTDRRFLEFLLQQLDTIEDGHMKQAEALTRRLFEFFVLLSYEKYQTGFVLEIPKILQLADGLLASSHNGKKAGNSGILAMYPVVMDLYFFRIASKSETAKELEIQQEVVASMLIKCVRYGRGALSLLSFILYETKKENGTRWRKLSRDIVDSLLPLLSKNQIPVGNSEDLSSLFSMTDFLCSSAFRPADPILSLMLAPPPATSTIEEFCSWLAYQTWCLRALVMYSNEATIASRLEEMPPVTVAANWIIGEGQNTGFVDPLGSTLQMNCEEILARLVSSVFKHMMERLGQAAVSRPTPSTLGFHEQLCYFYTSIVVHMCQLVDYSKFGHAFANLVQSGSIDVDESILWSFPELSLQWFQLLATARVYGNSCWKLVSAYGINPVLRRCIILFYCDHLKDTGHDLSSDILETFLSNNADIFDWFEETPVTEFLSIALNQPVCRVVLSKISGILCEEPMPKPARAIKLLQYLELANFESTIAVLDIVTRFIARCNHLSVAKMAGALALKKLDLLLVNRLEDTKTLLSLEVLIMLTSRFDLEMKTRFGVLYSRLEQLLRGWYTSAQCDVPDPSQEHDLVEEEASAPLPMPSKFNRVKFLAFLQSVLQARKGNASFCAEALNSLSIDDVVEILADERTTPRLLVACLAMDRPLPVSRSQSPPDKRIKCSEIADAARRTLIGAIRTILCSVPKDFRPIFTSRDFSVISDCRPNVSDRILDLTVAVHRLFRNPSLGPTLTESELRLLTTYLSTVITVYLKRLDTISIYHGRRLAKVFLAAFSSDHFCRILASSEFADLQFQFIGGAFWLCSKALRAKKLASYIEDLRITVDNSDLRISWQYCDAALRWLEFRHSQSFGACDRIARSLLLALCRLPSVASFTHIPPSAFKFGWAPEVRSTNGYYTLPTVPVHYLQNVETLREFIFRVNILGWSSRQQFEEIWMGLLGVLSATTIGRELLSNNAQEIEERIVASSFAVRCLSALLLQTLLSPTPGNPLASQYVLRPREKQSTFLKTTFGMKLCELRRRLRRQTDSDRDEVLGFGFNPERLLDSMEYSMAQLSVETLWTLTGILAEERDLVSGLPNSPAKRINSRVSEAYEAGTSVETPEREERTRWSRGSASFVSYADQSSEGPKSPDEFVAVRRSTSNFLLTSESGLDLVSCLHFLLDLFTHWFAGGPDDIPLVLLSSTVETMLYLSDLFTERSQYIWLRERLVLVYQSRCCKTIETEDELMLQDVILGLLKCSAVLGMNDAEKQKEAVSFMEVGLRSYHLSVRTASVHGILYVLQALTSDEIISLMPMLTEYVMPHIAVLLTGDMSRNLEKPQSLEHVLAVWAIGFYIIEAFHDPHTKTAFGPKFLELCCKALQSETLSIAILDAVINGLESFMVSTLVDVRLVGQLTRLATENVQRPKSAQVAVLFMEMLLTCLYTSKENRRYGDAATPESEVAPRVAGEPDIAAMERLTVLLNRVTEGSRFEASAIGSVLPEFLADHFSPSDVMNKVIIELLNPLQPHPQVLIRALHSLVQALLQQEVPAVVCDWVLVSLPSFAGKNPAHFSIWALTCLFLSASTNQWVKALWPLAMSRYNACESQWDWRLFCFAVTAFNEQLSEESQVENLAKTIAKAADRHPHSAYAKALEYLNTGKDSAKMGSLYKDDDIRLA